MSFVHRCWVLMLLGIWSSGTITQAEEFHVAFWNVENLFDTVDDPAVTIEEEFTPTGPKAWTEERLNIKLRNLAKIITAMNSGKGPDLLGLCEVENKLVVELLVRQLASLNRDYAIVHRDSPSERGIDCALLVDRKRITLLSENFHEVKGGEPTRDIVEAKVRMQDHDLFVFVNHWPSRRHDASQRALAGQTLRTRIDQILADNPQADLVLGGDFNDMPGDPSLKEALKSTIELTGVSADLLFNTSAEIEKQGQGTYVYDDKWNLLDQILVSPGMLNDKGCFWKKDSTKVALVMKQQLFDPAGPRIPRPNRSYSENKFHPSGYSDHLPIEAILSCD